MFNNKDFGVVDMKVQLTGKNVMVAPVGDEADMEALFIGIREFPTEKIYLLSRVSRIKIANKTKAELSKFKIPVSILELEDTNLWEDTFRSISDITSIEKGKSILINVATGDKPTRCASTSAAFVNGLKAFDVINNEPMMLPVLKFSYYKQLTDKKMEILKIMNNKDCCSSLEQLSKKTNMSLPLVSYHINGNLKSEGLKDLGLVDTVEYKGKVEVRLTTLGKMLVKGYVK